MRYRTRKYIINFLKYSLLLFILGNGYIYLANTGKLPAVFEVYTGKAVREISQDYYLTYLDYDREEQEDQEPGESMLSFKKFGAHDIIDIISQEPVYRYVSDVIAQAQKPGEIDTDTRNKLLAITSSPALIEWLKNPRGKFSSVYRYEFIREADRYDFISGLKVFADDKEIYTYKNGDFRVSAGGNRDTFYVENNRFRIQVASGGKKLGYLLGELDQSQLNIAFYKNPGMGVDTVITGEKNRILFSSSRSGNMWNVNGVYTGPYNGTKEGYRVVSFTRGDKRIIYIYKAPSVYFYVMRFVLYAIVLALAILAIYALVGKKSLIRRTIENSTKSEKEIVDKALSLNNQLLQLATQQSERVLDLKTKELDRLLVLSNHLGVIEQALFAGDKKELQGHPEDSII